MKRSIVGFFLIEIRKKESVSAYLSIRLLGEDALTKAF